MELGFCWLPPPAQPWLMGAVTQPTACPGAEAVRSEGRTSYCCYGAILEIPCTPLPPQV